MKYGLHYEVYGQGEETIVFLHGLPTSSYLYRKLTKSLSSKYKLVYIDLLGFGKSEKPKDNGSNYKWSTQACIISTILKELEVDTYTLAMHDMGSLVGLELLEKDLSKINNLILFNCILSKNGFNYPKFPFKFIPKALAKLYTCRPTSKLMLKSMFKFSGTKLSKSELEVYSSFLIGTNGDGIVNFFNNLNDDLFKSLKIKQKLFEKFKGNILSIWGEDDTILTPIQLDDVAKHFGGEMFLIKKYKGIKHFPMEEIENEVILDIKDFLG